MKQMETGSGARQRERSLARLDNMTVMETYGLDERQRKSTHPVSQEMDKPGHWRASYIENVIQMSPLYENTYGWSVEVEYARDSQSQGHPPAMHRSC